MSIHRPYQERVLCFGPGVTPRLAIDRVRRTGVGVATPAAATTGQAAGHARSAVGTAVLCDRPGLTPALDEGAGQGGPAVEPSGAIIRGADGEALRPLQPGEAHGHLVGTLSLPTEAPGGSGDRVGILLLNAGILARSGPHRFNVKLARRLAARGLPALRIDLSGHGDSGPPPGTLGYHEQTLADLGAAVDTLCGLAGVSRVVVVGICSGAQAGWHGALEDPRIVGLAMLDGHAYPSPYTWLLHRWRRLQARSVPEQFGVVATTLSRAVRRRIVRFLGGPRTGAANEREPAPEEAAQAGLGAADRLPVQLRSEDEYAEGMARLTARGVRSLIVYSCGWMAFYSYAGQYRHVFGQHAFSREVRLIFAPELDHTLTLVESQEAAAGWIEDWLTQSGLAIAPKEGR